MYLMLKLIGVFIVLGLIWYYTNNYFSTFDKTEIRKRKQLSLKLQQKERQSHELPLHSQRVILKASLHRSKKIKSHQVIKSDKAKDIERTDSQNEDEDLLEVENKSEDMETSERKVSEHDDGAEHMKNEIEVLSESEISTEEHKEFDKDEHKLEESAFIEVQNEKHEKDETIEETELKHESSENRQIHTKKESFIHTHEIFLEKIENEMIHADKKLHETYSRYSTHESSKFKQAKDSSAHPDIVSNPISATIPADLDLNIFSHYVWLHKVTPTLIQQHSGEMLSQTLQKVQKLSRHPDIIRITLVGDKIIIDLKNDNQVIVHRHGIQANEQNSTTLEISNELKILLGWRDTDDTQPELLRRDEKDI